MAGNLYRHYKGTVYRVLHNAIMEATMERMVVYQADDEPDGDFIWIRPASEFHGTVHNETPDGKAERIPRFAPIVKLTD